MQFDEALKLLGLKSGYTEQDLRVTYRKLMKQWHPDINPSAQAETMSQMLNEAYSILTKNLAKGNQGIKNDIMSYRHKSFFDIISTRAHSRGENKFRHKTFFDVVSI